MIRKLSVAALSIALLSALLLTWFDRPATEVKADAVSPSASEGFKAALLQRGFTIEAKQFGLADVVFLCCNGFLESCYGNNAGAPYMTLTYDESGIAVPEEVKLGPQDAIILVGKTPPPVSYFSYRSYLFSRYNHASADRDKLFISLGDTLNNQTINTGVGAGEEPFDRPVVLISTADRGTDEAVRSAARQAGLPEGIINTDVIPASVARLGLGEEGDNFVFLHRLMSPNRGLKGTFSTTWLHRLMRHSSSGRAQGCLGRTRSPCPSLRPAARERPSLT